MGAREWEGGRRPTMEAGGAGRGAHPGPARWWSSPDLQRERDEAA
jgi:hypothetical protein